jgi:hypothetical protein
LDQTPNDVPNSADAAPQISFCRPLADLECSSERDINAAFRTFIAQRVSARLVVGAGAFCTSRRDQVTALAERPLSVLRNLAIVVDDPVARCAR